MAYLKTDRDYIRKLEDCKAIFREIEDGSIKSISTARKRAKEAIGEIDDFLYNTETDKALMRIRRRLDRGHELNPSDAKILLDICEDIL